MSEKISLTMQVNGQSQQMQVDPRVTLLDALREHRDLDLGRAGVVRRRGELGHDALLGGGVEGHWLSLVLCCAVLRGMSTRAL